ncbi:MAG: hypothetical protein ACJ79E_00245 [Anaeromyxobacteraceae bacterium]
MTALVTLLLLAAAPPSSRDRVYAADQTSNTVSVVDPAAQKLVGVISLGAPRTDVLSPIYRGQANVHGLGFSPDHRTLVVVSVATNSVTFVDTATAKPRGVAYVGRAPHEAFYTPDGKEVWVSVRGESHIAVLDPVQMKEVRRIPVADGPGMVRFRPDGKVAFVVSSFTPEFDVVDVQTHEVVKRVPVASPFSPNLDVCSDGTVWMTHKDVGKVTILDAKTFEVKHVFDTGRITNHVACVDRGEERLAVVTVGGEDAVKVFTRAIPPRLVATIPTGALPHGIWPSDDGSRVFVGLENGDAVAAIDVAARRELVRIPSGQAPQALVYVSNAVPQGATEAVKPLDEAMRPVTVSLIPPDGDRPGAPHGLAVVRALGVADGLDLNVLALQPGTLYAAYVADVPKPPWKRATHVVDVKTNPKGAGAATAVGPLRELVKPGGAPPGRRWLVVVPAGTPDAAPVLAGQLGAPASGPGASP